MGIQFQMLKTTIKEVNITSLIIYLKLLHYMEVFKLKSQKKKKLI